MRKIVPQSGVFKEVEVWLMAIPVEKFRTAVKGFHRGDVVQFIRSLTAEHERQLRLLREENERLKARIDALTQENAALKAAPAPQAQPDMTQQELAAYRRAEQAERSARERAGRTAGQMREVLSRTEEKLQRSAQEIDALAGVIDGNITELQALLQVARTAIDPSGEELRALCALADEE